MDLTADHVDHADRVARGWSAWSAVQPIVGPTRETAHAAGPPTNPEEHNVIPGTGWEASYKHPRTRADGKTHWTWAHLPVVFFDEDGEGFVADGNGTLRRAEDIAGFDGFQQSGQIVAILPLPPGVKVRYKHDDGTEGLSPFGLWGLKANGDVVVLDSDSSGYMEEASAVSNFDGLTEPPEVEVRDR